MIEIEKTKNVLMMYPQLKDNGAFANNAAVDTAGFHHLRVIFAMGATDADVGSTAADAKPFIEESETAAGTYTKVTGAELGGVIEDDDDGKLFCIDIDLSKEHKRFMRVNAPTAADGTAGAAMCIIGVLSQKVQGYLPNGSEFAEQVKA